LAISALERAWKAYSERTLKGLRLTDRYTVPPMPFGLSASEAARLPAEIPEVAAVREAPLPLGRGLWGARLVDLPAMRDWRPAMNLVSFGRG
jgi:hypothetical protein